MTTLSPEQLARILKYEIKRKAPDAERWNPALDAECAGMFARRWGELEKFNPLSNRLYHILNWTCVLGGFPDPNHIPLLASVFTTTLNQALREKARTCLQKSLADCSGDGEYKDDVRAALKSWPEV